MVVVRRVLVGVLLAMSVAAWAATPSIEVVGLFKNIAVLRVNGKRELLRAGQRSREGILLLKADSRGALVDVNGRRMKLTLSSRVGAHYQPVQSASVAIALNEQGQYRTSGMVDDQPVSFLVDTGASIVAMNAHQAKRLGIDYRHRDRQSRAMTAGGMVKSWAINLDAIQIGGIRVTNVPAVVLQGDYPPQEVLLGMTFLRNVQIKQTANLMILKSRVQ